jgi:hypothetical protein
LILSEPIALLLTKLSFEWKYVRADKLFGLENGRTTFDYCSICYSQRDLLYLGKRLTMFTWPSLLHFEDNGNMTSPGLLQRTPV